MPIQHPDSYDYITFSAQTQKLITRAEPYEDYNPESHPATMGAFGYYDIATSTNLTPTDASQANLIFNNETVSYDATTKTWKNSTKKRWDSYQSSTALDFFAYMPQTAGAKVTRKAANTYTLSVPFTMPGDAPFLYDTKSAPVVCEKPINKDMADPTFERVVRFRFDQTLAGYTLHFTLDSKMNAIRQFRIKSVNFSGEIAVAGTYNRTYTWSATDKWTAAAIQWTDIKTATATSALPYKSQGTAAYDDTNKTALVTATGTTQWGETFYTIPYSKFEPMITVTYDVVFMDEKQNEVITRKDVTSTILLNKTNFSGLTTGTTAQISPITILIQPRYLYVMADQDAYTGRLLIQ